MSKPASSPGIGTMSIPKALSTINSIGTGIVPAGLWSCRSSPARRRSSSFGMYGALNATRLAPANQVNQFIQVLRGNLLRP